ncbi:MAG: DNA mismatch repair endonuclease MutL [Dehalococcoidales bacterium]|nr:MAG: DNA mismatch repair endonuclease MutL [Dehalococcoidales bacterium]
MAIRILDREMISRIAAGEVIERPASVVKELVENSLDAGSTQISVETSGGGIGMIRVTDNGIGIPAGELELAFQRHATSKVNNPVDLESIGSLGFRGEALPSIAAVSRIEVITCVEGETTGSYLELKEGTTQQTGSRGRSQGTTITVRDLLRNVPARLKFLKSTSTENGHIANVVSQYALAYPEVRFTLTVDGRTTVRTPGTGRLSDVILEIYGAETARGMVKLDEANAMWKTDSVQSQVKINGMVGSPAITRANRNYMSFFVNRRWINSRVLSYAVEEAYHGMLMQSRHPVSVINISIPPGDVDVNIHPTKTEVKFKDDRPVFSAVQKAVRHAILQQSPVPVIEEVSPEYNQSSRQEESLFTSPAPGVYHNRNQVDAPPLTSQQFTPSQSLPVLRLVGQISGTYIIAEGPEGLYIIDQHAAHERILFEKIREQSTLRKVEIQGLLEPATFEVSPAQDEVLKTCYVDLSEFGFAIEPFGDRSYLVRSVPAMLNGKDWSATLRELLDTVGAEKGSDWREQLGISFACHGAIKAGKVLTDEEMRELLRQLEKTTAPNTCPHGRPTIIRLTNTQLEREFRRT